MNYSQIIFETEEIEAIENQSIIPRSSYTLTDGNEAVHQTPNNSDLLALLQQLLDGQKNITSQLEKIQNNQRTLSLGQASIGQNQEQLALKLEAIEANAVTKPELMAQSKIIMECKVGIKRAQESLRRMTGETCDQGLDEIASMLPLRTTAAVKEIEEKLDSDYAQAMNSYIHKIKGVSLDAGSVIRALFTDELLDKYNWDGRWGKLSLASLTLLNKIVRDVFQNLGTVEYEKSIKKSG